MDKMKDLKDLLKHEVMDLYSAEEQIIDALPKMIEKAKDPALKKALQEHLKVTRTQKTRLDKVQQLLREKGEAAPDTKRGFLSGLFGGGGQKCKGTQGLIEEGEKIMKEDMNTEVMDAAIIASAQKIEHYEICGYGTAKAFALELNRKDIAQLLDQTLNEEYFSDDLLTKLAVGRLNQEAEQANTTKRKAAAKSKSGASKKASSSKSNRSTASKSAVSANRSAASKSNGRTSSKSAAGKTAAKKAGTRSR
jgi:ferritin-like metal-binding protein YciE